MTQEEKVELVRRNIIEAAQVYLNNFIGKKFLYVFGEEYIEVRFLKSNFMHLTGVDSKRLKPEAFYEKSKLGHIKRNQIFFSARHPLSIAIGKSEELKRLDIFKRREFYVIKNFSTGMRTYDFCFSDVGITLGLVRYSEIIDGLEKVYNFYIPQTLRIHEKASEKVGDNQKASVRFIFSKIDDAGLYTTMEFTNGEEVTALPLEIQLLIDSKRE